LWQYEHHFRVFRLLITVSPRDPFDLTFRFSFSNGNHAVGLITFFELNELAGQTPKKNPETPQTTSSHLFAHSAYTHSLVAKC
jgi:hypothetical protein